MTSFFLEIGPDIDYNYFKIGYIFVELSPYEITPLNSKYILPIISQILNTLARKTTSSTVVFNWCEIWSLAVREVQK
jgi:hypothetical protein